MLKFGIFAVANLMQASPKVYEDKILAAIEEYRQLMITGDPASGIPSFAPLQLAFVPVNLENNTIVE